MIQSFPRLDEVSRRVFIETSMDTQSLANVSLSLKMSGLVVCELRGIKMRKVSSLFDEFGAALQFPYYFSDNWSSFEECISDLDWHQSFKNGIVLVVYSASDVLSHGDNSQLKVLIDVLTSAADSFATPIELGEWWDRGPVPFHVVLQAPHGQSLLGWEIDPDLVSVVNDDPQ